MDDQIIMEIEDPRIRSKDTYFSIPKNTFGRKQIKQISKLGNKWIPGKVTETEDGKLKI